MKSKSKKILAAACLGLVGIGCLTGCDMSAEDMEKWENKADTLIDTVNKSNEVSEESNKLLKEQIENLDKQTAYDILRNANTNMMLLNLGTSPYVIDGRTYCPNATSPNDEDYNGENFIKYLIIPTEKEFTMKQYNYNEETNSFDSYYLRKTDFNMQIDSWDYVGDYSALTDDKFAVMELDDYVEWKSEIMSFMNNFGMTITTSFDIDNIISFEKDENDVVTIKLITSYIYDSGNSGENLSKYVDHHTISIKDGLFTSYDKIRFYASDVEFILDANGEKIPDGCGSYEIVDVPTYDEQCNYTFTYGSDIDATELKNTMDKIAEIDAKVDGGNYTAGEWNNL